VGVVGCDFICICLNRGLAYVKHRARRDARGALLRLAGVHGLRKDRVQRTVDAHVPAVGQPVHLAEARRLIKPGINPAQASGQGIDIRHALIDRMRRDAFEAAAWLSRSTLLGAHGRGADQSQREPYAGRGASPS